MISFENDIYTLKDIRINNHAYEQQQNNQLEDLYLSMPFNFTEEEIRKLKKKHRKL